MFYSKHDIKMLKQISYYKDMSMAYHTISFITLSDGCLLPLIFTSMAGQNWYD